MPSPDTWNSGSGSSAYIGGFVYYCGGIVGSSTVNNHARYDPAANTWLTRANMPAGRNHAASGTDGSKFYVFGGRGPGSGDGNVVANGFDNTYVYNPATNTWDTTMMNLPQKRGGTGKAAFLNNEFYVIGGETINGGGGATGSGVYKRVDIYNPFTNTWRLGADMPTARHGIFPVAYNGKLYVAGGGTNAGFSNSNVLEIYTPTTLLNPSATVPFQ